MKTWQSLIPFQQDKNEFNHLLEFCFETNLQNDVMDSQEDLAKENLAISSSIR